MHFPRNSTSKKQNPKQDDRDPPSALSRVVAARCAPRAQSQQRAPFPGADPWSPGEQLRSAVAAPIPAPGVDATRYRAALSRRRSWPIPPANCAEAAHDRWKCVIRTGDKLRFCLRLSAAKTGTFQAGVVANHLSKQLPMLDMHP